jgi:hypothetical protein
MARRLVAREKKAMAKKIATKTARIKCLQPVEWQITPEIRKAWHRQVTAEFAQEWAHWQVTVAIAKSLPPQTSGVYTSLREASESYIAQFGGEPVHGFDDAFRQYMDDYFKEMNGDPYISINPYLDWLEMYII